MVLLKGRNCGNADVEHQHNKAYHADRRIFRRYRQGAVQQGSRQPAEPSSAATNAKRTWA